jgi:hypothetical protein
MVILFGRGGGGIKHPKYQYSFNPPDVHFCIQCSAPFQYQLETSTKNL